MSVEVQGGSAGEFAVPAPGTEVSATGPTATGLIGWRRLPLLAEVATLLCGYLLYEVVQFLAPAAAAQYHAQLIMRLEQLWHLNIELAVNGFVTHHPVLADASGVYYGTLHFVLTPAMLVWLWWRRPAFYARLRSALVVLTLAALVVFWLYPVAPPRLEVPGAVDTLERGNILGAADKGGIHNFVNLYASMPSLHVAWALWCALAVVVATTHPWRHLAWLYPAATTFVVLGTANHYVADALGAALIVWLAWWLTGRTRSRTGHPPQHPVGIPDRVPEGYQFGA